MVQQTLQSLYDFAIDVTAVGIEKSPWAVEIAKKRDVFDTIARRALSVRRAIKDLKYSSRLVVRGIRMGMRL